MTWRRWLPIEVVNMDRTHEEVVRFNLAWTWEWRLWPIVIWWGYGFNLSLGPAMLIANWSNWAAENRKLESATTEEVSATPL
jgi:hypothetical protein